MEAVMNRPPAAPPVNSPDERWYTVTEAALLLHRSRKTVLNLIYEHDLPRRRIRQGRSPRRILYFSDRTLLRLRALTRS